MTNKRNKYILIALCGMFLSQSDSKASDIELQNNSTTFKKTDMTNEILEKLDKHNNILKDRIIGISNLKDDSSTLSRIIQFDKEHESQTKEIEKLKKNIPYITKDIDSNLAYEINRIIVETEKLDKEIRTLVFDKEKDLQNKELIGLWQELENEINKFEKKIKEVDEMTLDPKEQVYKYEEIIQEIYEYIREAYVQTKWNYPYIPKQSQLKIKINEALNKGESMRRDTLQKIYKIK